MTLNKSLLFAFALSAVSGLSYAADGSSSGSLSTDPAASSAKQWSSFGKVDANSNGYIEQSEAASVSGLDFNATDSDSDGRISRSEYEAAMRNAGSDKSSGNARTPGPADSTSSGSGSSSEAR